MEQPLNINDVFVRKGQLPLSAQSSYSAIPTSRDAPRNLTYFNNDIRRFLCDSHVDLSYIGSRTSPVSAIISLPSNATNDDS